MCTTIPEVMISDTPLPIPYLSICSPSHIKNTVPAVSPTSPHPQNTHDPPPSACAASTSPCVIMKLSQNNDCTRHKSTVTYRVRSWIFCCPLGPSLRSCCKLGSTFASNWKMIAAEMYGITPSPKIVDCPERPPR